MLLRGRRGSEEQRAAEEAEAAANAQDDADGTASGEASETGQTEGKSGHFEFNPARTCSRASRRHWVESGSPRYFFKSAR